MFFKISTQTAGIVPFVAMFFARLPARPCIMPSWHSHPENMVKPFAPIRSSAWLRCPNMRSKPPTKWLRKVPRPFRSFVARRRRASGMISRHAAVDVRCPKVVARPRPMNRCDPFDARRRCRGQRACQLDACRPDPGLTVPVDDVLEKQEDVSSSVDERRELHLLAYRSFE